MNQKEVDALLDEVILVTRNLRLILDNALVDLEELIPPKCEYCGSFNMQERSREIDSDESVYYMHCNDCKKDESLGMTPLEKEHELDLLDESQINLNKN